MIDPEKHGIEVGDRIRISIEGVVKEGGLYDPHSFNVNGVGLYPWTPPVGCSDLAVEILEKVAPRWHSAKVIKADLVIPPAGKAPERIEGIYHVRCASGLPNWWLGDDGYTRPADRIANVEVIVP